jgi:hypothetical protein
MNANVLSRLTRPRRPRGRTAIALLPGAFALVLAGVSGVAASGNPGPAVTGMFKATPTTTPTPTLTPCAYFTKSGTCCPNPKKPCTTPTTTPSPKSGPPGSGNNGGGGGSTTAPTPVPTTTAGPNGTPGPTSTPTSPPVASPGGSGSGHSSGGGAAGTTGPSGATGATHTHSSDDPTPFAPLTSAVTTLTSGRGLDAARIPPVEALTPLSGLAFGSGLNLGPILLLIDLVGIGLLVYLVRTRWLAPEA